MDSLLDTFDQAQAWLFETLMQPAMVALGLEARLEDGFEGTGWFLVGCVQLALLLLVVKPLQHWRPVEPVTDHAAIRTDLLYTLIQRLGLFALLLYFTLDPLTDAFIAQLRGWGWPTLHLDDLWPGVTDVAWVSFALYLVVWDALGYAIHRAQHHFGWWWQLHALHHSQRQMTLWSDSRNHLLDDVLRDLLKVLVAQAIGVAPGQFVALVALTQLSESLQHANLRLWFGRFGEYLWVSPRFHRVHHSIGLGHESRGKNTLGGHNFGVLLPWWDVLFGTADMQEKYPATGIRDQVEAGVDYGQGWWAQQWLGCVRLWRSLRGTSGA